MQRWRGRRRKKSGESEEEDIVKNAEEPKDVREEQENGEDVKDEQENGEKGTVGEKLDVVEINI